MAIKVTKTEKKDKREITVKTMEGKKAVNKGFQWWRAGSKREMAEQLLSTAGFLKEQQAFRFRQASIFARLYGNMPFASFMGSSITKLNVGNELPIDRPTMNVVQSCTDTLVSRITQSKPRPVFLTDNGDYKARNTAKQLNGFVMGEFYRTKAYHLGALALRDSCVIGDGLLKIYEKDKRVAIDRVLAIETLVDLNDALYSDPRTMYQFKLVDRAVLADFLPDSKSLIAKAEQAYPQQNDSQKSVSDQIMVVEAWHLPSGKDAGDGLHAIVCSEGIIHEETWEKQTFPFVRLPYCPRMLGWDSQGLAEQLMGTQVEINKLLMTISASINLVGVPRVFLEKGSKVVKAHLNNNVGSIVEYSGTKPMYEVAPCMPQEVYAQLQRLIEYAYQQSGVSALAAASQKPAGLNSGEAIRNYNDIQSDRFATLVKRYDDFYIDLAYQVIDKAKDIAERDGKYATVFPNKDGTREINLPKIDLLDDPIIQCFDSSSLPREPAGRLAKVTELMQAGIITPQEGRRLLDYPDIEQVDKLANAPEERILQYLDMIIEDGKYNPPDPFMDLNLAEQLVTQYYNRYIPAKLEDSKAEQLRTFANQVRDLKLAAQPPMLAPMMPGDPQAVAAAPPVSDLISQVPIPA
jgi:hypothetical protein